jgi:hypothetical protein
MNPYLLAIVVAFVLLSVMYGVIEFITWMEDTTVDHDERKELTYEEWYALQEWEYHEYF